MHAFLLTDRWRLYLVMVVDGYAVRCRKVIDIFRHLPATIEWCMM